MKVQRTIAFAIALALIALGAVACGGGNSTPTKAVQTAFSATKNKDVKAFKSILPKDALKKMEDAAKAQNKNVDDLLKAYLDVGAKDDMPDKLETQNETINGDKATVEVKNKDGKWDKVDLIKEDDGWKMAIPAM